MFFVIELFIIFLINFALINEFILLGNLKSKYNSHHSSTITKGFDTKFE